KAGQPQQTKEAIVGVNLPVKAGLLDPALFDATNSETYTSSTSMTIYDSMGDTHTLTQYFVKVGPDAAAVPPTGNEWQMRVYVDGEDALAPIPLVPGPGTEPGYLPLSFDASGSLTAPLPKTEIQTIQLPFTNGSATDQQVTVKIPSATLNSGPFEVTQNSQDGTTVGRLTKVDVGPNGLVQATYSNGTTENLGIVAMARFPNEQGLTQIGDTQWSQSLLSGEAVTGQPNTGVFGKVSVAALEQSNTNLTSELVDLITAQRNFQANSRALEVNSTLQQTILQIR
ncbi:MAG: flagellar hook-basal body complex protein, partial [Candidatus Oceanisphaera merdipullorum]|nr:flagellar hook-basal body complex protein [Candidatus Oceanisphaera merdipullorum]